MMNLSSRLVLLLLFVLPTPSRSADYAFLVGCSEYENHELRPLPCAINDLEGFRKSLLDNGVDKGRIQMFHDRQPYRYLPEKAKILPEFKRFLSERKQEDNVVVVFCGRGLHYRDEPSGYFCPSDARIWDERTLIGMEGEDGILPLLKECKAGRKLLIMNACRHNPTTDLSLAKMVDLKDDYPEKVPAGIVLMNSCSREENSYFDVEQNRSVFFDELSKAWVEHYRQREQGNGLERVLDQTKAQTEETVRKRWESKQRPQVMNQELLEAAEMTKDWKEFLAAREIDQHDEWHKERCKTRLEAWRRAAAEKDARAMVLVGRCYICGYGVEKDPKEAVKWYREAADLGETVAMTNLARCYLVGEGVAKDGQECMKWIRLAVDKGSPDAMAKLGMCYQQEVGVKKDVKEAVKWYRLAAEKGNGMGMNNLAVCYERGDGIVEDLQEAIKWYRLAVEKEIPQAMFALGAYYHHGLGLGKNIQEALKLYRCAADKGLPQAQSRLGECYMLGEGVAADKQEGIKWFRLAAEQGDGMGMYDLGMCYESGDGVVKDAQEAVKWYQLAVARGEACAMYNLANCYERGVGVAKDLQEAVKWYRLSADKGQPEAMNNLGACYEHGDGIDKDINESVKWYQLAAEKGITVAKRNLGLCLSASVRGGSNTAAGCMDCTH